MGRDFEREKDRERGRVIGLERERGIDREKDRDRARVSEREGE
jgi:hypothetical protein